MEIEKQWNFGFESDVSDLISCLPNCWVLFMICPLNYNWSKLMLVNLQHSLLIKTNT